MCLGDLIQRTHIKWHVEFKFNQITFFNSVFNGKLENNPFKKDYLNISNKKLENLWKKSFLTPTYALSNGI